MLAATFQCCSTGPQILFHVQSPRSKWQYPTRPLYLPPCQGDRPLLSYHVLLSLASPAGELWHAAEALQLVGWANKVRRRGWGVLDRKASGIPGRGRSRG